MINEGIIKNLKSLMKYYDKIKDRWRTQAYQKAIFAIQSLDEEITDVKQIKNLKGVGKGIRDKIKEYLETGKMSKVDEVQKIVIKYTDSENAMTELQRVWGIGPAKAKSLYKLGIKNVQELYDNTHLLTKNQKIGLKYYNELDKPIPREYIRIFELALKTVITKDYGLDSFRLQIAGSYRRGVSESGDIDCLVTSKVFDLSDMVNTLIKWNIITNVLSVKDEKFMGVAHCPGGGWYHFRMDIEFLPEDEWGSGLLYFTGSKGFNVFVRMEAKKKGYTLNQHGLFDKNGVRVAVYTEKEILSFLGIKYRSPDRR